MFTPGWPLSALRADRGLVGGPRMNEGEKRTCSVALRLTDAEKLQIEARAAAEGKAPSAYMRDILLGEARRPLPTLAAASSLLAICRALTDAAERHEIPNEVQQFVRQQADLVFELLRQHGHRGTRS